MYQRRRRNSETESADKSVGFTDKSDGFQKTGVTIFGRFVPKIGQFLLKIGK
jgi:hypothetical protein